MLFFWPFLLIHEDSNYRRLLYVLFISETEELTQNDFKRVEPLAIQGAFALQDLLARKWAKVVHLCLYAFVACLHS